MTIPKAGWTGNFYKAKVAAESFSAFTLYLGLYNGNRVLADNTRAGVVLGA